MPSLNVDLNYFDHPKTKRLIGILGDRADVYPLRLWAYAGRFFPQEGVLKDHGTGEIESILGWTGKAGELEAALIKVAYATREGEHLKVHDWKDHEGHLYSYHKRAKLAAKSRWNDRILEASDKDATSNAPAVQSSAVQSKAKDTPSAAPKAEPTAPVAPSVIDPHGLVQRLAQSKAMPKANGAPPAEPKPYKAPTTPLACLLVGIKVLQGYAPDDRAWDAGMFARYSKPASELLKFFEGDWKAALKTSEAMVNYFKSKSLSWTVETLVRHAPEWKNKGEN